MGMNGEAADADVGGAPKGCFSLAMVEDWGCEGSSEWEGVRQAILSSHYRLNRD